MSRWRTLLSCGLALLAMRLICACDSPPSGADIAPPPPAARLVRQGGTEILELQNGRLPDMTVSSVKEVSLPGILETTGQISFDDRKVANIISRVSGRIERVFVSQWDHVSRGQPIVTLYSPDFMTAEAEYLQAKAGASTLAAGGADSQ